MQNITVYNSHYNCPVTIIVNSNKIDVNPKESIEIKVDGLLGSKNFRLEENQKQDWKEQYHGRYNQNLILRLPY